MDDGEMACAPAGRMQDLFKNNRQVFNDEVKKRVATYEWDKKVARESLLRAQPAILSDTPPM